MPRRRRDTRRRSRERRRHRDPAERVDLPSEQDREPNVPGQPLKADRPERDITFTGLMGGATGFGGFVLLGVGILVDPADESRWWAALPFVISLMFVPAIIVSVVSTELRMRVLRASTVACLALAMVGTLWLGLGFAMIMGIPTTLLAIAAGFIFQTRPSSR